MNSDWNIANILKKQTYELNERQKSYYADVKTVHPDYVFSDTISFSSHSSVIFDSIDAPKYKILFLLKEYLEQLWSELPNLVWRYLVENDFTYLNQTNLYNDISSQLGNICQSIRSLSTDTQVLKQAILFKLMAVNPNLKIFAIRTKKTNRVLQYIYLDGHKERTFNPLDMKWDNRHVNDEKIYAIPRDVAYARWDIFCIKDGFYYHLHQLTINAINQNPLIKFKCHSGFSKQVLKLKEIIKI
jgi:hypothetical protein